MNQLETSFPIVAIVAIVLFFAKEFLEKVRNISAKNRKLQSIKTFLAEECERNYWTKVSIYRALRNILYDSSLSQNKCKFHKTIDGREFYVMIDEGDNESRQTLPKFHTESYKEFIFYLAEYDKQLFECAKSTYLELADLNNERDFAIRFLLGETSPLSKDDARFILKEALNYEEHYDKVLKEFYNKLSHKELSLKFRHRLV